MVIEAERRVSSAARGTSTSNIRTCLGVREPEELKNTNCREVSGLERATWNHPASRIHVGSTASEPRVGQHWSWIIPLSVSLFSCLETVRNVLIARLISEALGVREGCRWQRWRRDGCVCV